MSEMAVTRKQRLRTLENQIRKDYEAFVATGFALKEIRDDRLYEEDGYATWDAYLKEQVGMNFGIEKTYANRLISAAQIRTKLPELSGTTVSNKSWAVSAVNAFGRLAPQDEDHEQRRDYDRLNKRDVER